MSEVERAPWLAGELAVASVKPARTQQASDGGRRRVQRRALVDLLGCGLVVLAAGLSFTHLDAFEWLMTTLVRFEGLQLDDLLLTLVVALAAALVFAFRRWQDARERVEALSHSERERASDVVLLDRLSVQVMQAEEHARARLADVLHDGVVQTLYACQLKLSLPQAKLQDERAQAELAEAQALLESSMDELRELTVELCPPILSDLGLEQGLGFLCTRLCARFGTPVSLRASAVWKEVDPELVPLVFHAVKELVTNAAKHAQASRIEVSAQRSAHALHVDVRDDGRGFEVPAVRHAASLRGTFGLFSVERRLLAVGGRLEVCSEPGRGTRAVLHLPCASSAREA